MKLATGKGTNNGFLCHLCYQIVNGWLKNTITGANSIVAQNIERTLFRIIMDLCNQLTPPIPENVSPISTTQIKLHQNASFERIAAKVILETHCLSEK